MSVVLRMTTCARLELGCWPTVITAQANRTIETEIERVFLVDFIRSAVPGDKRVSFTPRFSEVPEDSNQLQKPFQRFRDKPLKRLIENRDARVHLAKARRE